MDRTRESAKSKSITLLSVMASIFLMRFDDSVGFSSFTFSLVGQSPRRLDHLRLIKNINDLALFIVMRTMLDCPSASPKCRWIHRPEQRSTLRQSLPHRSFRPASFSTPSKLCSFRSLSICHAARPTSTFDYDLVIIGCGVGGHGAALHAVEQVRHSTHIEDKKFLFG